METVSFEKLDYPFSNRRLHTHIFNRLRNLLVVTPRVDDIFSEKTARKNLVDELKALDSGISKDEINRVILDFVNAVEEIKTSTIPSIVLSEDKKNRLAAESIRSAGNALIKEAISIKEELDSLDEMNEILSLKLFLLIDLHIIIMLFLSNSMIEYKYSKSTDSMLFALFKDGKVFFRGHSNSNYKLVPSIFRNLKKQDSIITCRDLEQMYDESGLIEKYKQISSRPLTTIDYSFLTYIQHSCAYSPLLDFTSDIDVAKIFSVHEQNFNSYKYNDAALFVFEPEINQKTETVDNCLKQYEISFHMGKLNYKSRIFGKPLFLCTLEDFTPKYAFFDSTTNDRMKYQKGSFLLIYKAVIVKERICLTYDIGSLFKFTIPANLRNDIYNDVVLRKRHLDYRYLMDPYLYLSECGNKK